MTTSKFEKIFEIFGSISRYDNEKVDWGANMIVLMTSLKILSHSQNPAILTTRRNCEKRSLCLLHVDVD